MRGIALIKNEVEMRALVHKEMRPLVMAMNGAMARLQSLIASQRRFIADASHQLRTPLTVLKTQAELALRACERHQGDTAALKDIVQGISGTVDSTVHLANRLLTLARIEHGADALQMPQLWLREIVHRVALEMALPAVNKQIDLSLEAEWKTMVWAQELLLHELVANLVDNALRYTPFGGAVTLRVTPQAGNTGAALQVEDSGSGIPEHERERVFAPFYRASSTLERNPGGAGLGLAIVRDIAALSEGAGGGLTATLTFASSSQGAGQRGLFCKNDQ